jgi:hypothetical protein
MPEVNLEMLQALVQRVLEEVASFREETRIELRRLGGRITQLDRRFTKAAADMAADLQGQIDELSERIAQLEERES